MEKIGSFRLQGVDSLMVLGRCNSSVLLSETISDECDRIANYERLSQSMRFVDEELSHGLPTKKKKPSWLRVSWVFSKHGHGDRRNDKIKEDAAAAGSDKLREKKKRRPSWLPDPDRRWPVQGW